MKRLGAPGAGAVTGHKDGRAPGPFIEEWSRGATSTGDAGVAL